MTIIPVGTLPSSISQIRDSLPAAVAKILVNQFKAGTCLITLPVQWGDLDAFQHLNNVSTLRYFESARMAHFYQVFQPALEPRVFQDLVHGRNYGPIVKSITCSYRSQITFPDTVTLGIRAESLGSDRFDQHFLAVSHKQERIFADGKATIVMFDYEKQKKAILSPQLVKALVESNLENERLSLQNTVPK